MPGRKSAAVVPQRNKPYKHSVKKAGASKKQQKQPSAGSARPLTKAARKQRSANLRKAKIGAARSATDSLNSPRLIALIPLKSSVNVEGFLDAILRFIFADLAKNKLIAEPFGDSASSLFENTKRRLLEGEIVQIPLPSWCREAQHLQLILARRPQPGRENQQQLRFICQNLDICKAADLVIPLYGEANCDDAGFDHYSNELVSLSQKQGLPTAVGISIHPESSVLAGRSFETSFGKENRFFTLDLKDQTPRLILTNLVRHLASVTLSQIHWRGLKRGYALVNSSDLEFGLDGRTVLVRAFVRGVGVSVKNPIHVTGLGDFALTQIDVLPMRGRIVEFGTPITISTLEEKERYARAWPIFEEHSADSETVNGNQSEMEDQSEAETEDLSRTDDADRTDDQGDDQSDAQSDYYSDGQSEMRGDLMPRERADMEFYEEVDTPNDQPARERFRKYRGLKSFKNSNWDNLAEDENKSLALMIKLSPYKKQLELLADHYLSGLKSTTDLAKKHIKGSGREWAYQLKLSSEFDITPDQSMSAFKVFASENPVILISTISLLERKCSIQHYSMTSFGDSRDLIIPSKSSLLLQCGFRRQIIRPLFSYLKTAKTHAPYQLPQKLPVQRYLNQRGWDSGDSSSSSISQASLIFSAVASTCQFVNDPCLSWVYDLNSSKEEEMDGFMRKYPNLRKPEFGVSVASGRFLKSDPERLLIKKIILTGYPHKISGRRATITRMFMNRQDVEYFARVALTTAKGKAGKIVEPLGMHGVMKCYFEEPVDHAETVCLPLYKRVYPPMDSRTFQTFAF